MTACHRADSALAQHARPRPEALAVDALVLRLLMDVAQTGVELAEAVLGCNSRLETRDRELAVAVAGRVAQEDRAAVDRRVPKHGEIVATAVGAVMAPTG